MVTEGEKAKGEKKGFEPMSDGDKVWKNGKGKGKGKKKGLDDDNFNEVVIPNYRLSEEKHRSGNKSHRTDLPTGVVMEEDEDNAMPIYKPKS